MHNYIPLLHILRSNLKRYFLLILTLITSSVVMGQEITIPIKNVTATPDNVPTDHKGDGHQSHAIQNIIDGNAATTWISDQTRVIKILDFLQLKGANDYKNGMRNWIEVPYIPNNNTEIEIVFMPNTTSSTNGTTQNLFGCGYPRYGSGMSFNISWDGSYIFKSSNKEHTFSVKAQNDKIYTIICSLASVTIDGGSNLLPGTIGQADNSEEVITTGNNGQRNLCIFSSPYESQEWARCFDGKIYSVKIREKGKLCMDLMPAVENGVMGFYDRISTDFYHFNAHPVDYVENINETNSNKDRVHVKIPLSPEPASGYEWSKSLVQNGYLSSNNLSSFQSNDAAQIPVQIIENLNGVKTIKVTSKQKVSENWDSQFLIILDEPLQQGDKYYVSFDYRTEDNVTTNVQTQTQNGWKYNGGGIGTISFTPNWQHGSWTGEVSADQAKNGGLERIAFNLNVRSEATNYYFTNIVVKKQVPTTPAVSAGKRWSDNLVHNGTLETDDASGFDVNRCNMTVAGNALVVNKEQQSGQNAWYSQIFIKLDDSVLPNEKVYISFDYKSSNAANVYIQAQYKGAAKDAVLGTTLNFKAQWQTYSRTLTVPSDGLDRIGFNINGNTDQNVYYLRNVVIRKETTLDPGKKWSETLVKNGDFSGDDLSSFTQWGQEESGIETVDGQRALKFKSSTGTDGQGFIEFNEILNKGDKYTIFFEYKADVNITVGTQAHHNPGTYNAMDPIGKLDFKTSWQSFTFSGTIDNEVKKDAEGNQTQGYKSLKFDFPKGGHSYYLRNVVVRKQVDADPAPTEPSLNEGMQWSKSLVKNGHFSTSDLSSSFAVIGGSGDNATTMAIVNDIEKGKAIQVVSRRGNLGEGQGAWNSQFRVKLSERLNAGEKYYISFDYKADKEFSSYTTHIYTGSNPEQETQNPATNWNQLTYKTSWQTFSDIITFTPDNGKDPYMDMIAFMLHSNNLSPITFSFANIVVKKMVPINEEDKPVSELTIKFQGLNENTGESFSVRHLFSLGTHEEEIMALTTRYGKYNYVSGGITKETNIGIDKNEHTATFKAGACIFDGTTYTVEGVPTWNSADALYLMGTHCDPVTNHNGYAPRSFYGRIYSATLTENGIKRVELIPAMNANGEYGFIDMLTNKFYGVDGCSGTGADGKLGGSSEGYGGGAQETGDFKMPFKIDFTTGHPQVVRDFAITTALRETGDQVNYNNPLKWVLYGSNNGSTWKQLKESDVSLDTNGEKYKYTLTDNKESFSQYRLIVEKVNVANSSANPPFSRLRLADIALSTNYSFEHYHGRVYDNSPLNIPENLRVGGSSGYKSEWKTSEDDSRLTEGVTIQRTHEYEHVIYVLPGTTVNLTPFSDFDYANVTNDNGYNNAYNYREQYIRWYDYNTDLRSNNLSFDPRNGHEVNALDNGHFAWNLRNDGCRTREGSVAKYTADSEPTVDANGVIDVIALEAGNVFDINDGRWDNDIYVIKEPTLQWRHTFVIKDARTRADEMEANNANYIAKNKITLMCPANTPFQYPLPCFEYAKNGTDHPTDYYKKNGDNYEAIQHYLIETTYNSNKNSTYLTFDSEGNAVINYTNGGLNNNETAYSFKEKDGYNRVFYMLKPQVGTYTIKIFALESGNTAGMQLMEYELKVLPPKDGVMVNSETLYNNSYAYKNQIPEKMDEIFGTPTTKVDFDNIIPEQIATAPTTDNSCKDLTASGTYLMWPWQWENSSYGFGYEDRGDYNMYMVADHMSITPFHGRNDNDTNYNTFHNVYDRKYYDNGEDPNKKGYFFYANAASDPSRMATLNIGKDFCPNTKVYVSAWINEFQGKDLYAETANVIFSFRGVKDGVETVLNSFVSGYVSGGWNTPNGYIAKTIENRTETIHHINAETNPDNRGKWMHVYYTFSTTHTEEYDYYIITLENNCTSSEGADYAIDDIRAYVLKPNLQARLMDPVCDKNSGTKIEIYGDFEQLKDAFFPDASENTSQTLRYCFLDKEIFDNTYKTEPDIAFNAALIQNVYGGTEPKYGLLTFNSSFSENSSYDEDWYTNSEFSNFYKGHKPEIGDIIIFPCKENDVQINPGKSYILAIATTNTNFDVGGKCSRTSVFKIPNPVDIKIDGTLQTAEGGVSACANQRPEVNIDMNGVSMGGAPVSADVLKFDWYYGPLNLGDLSDINSPKSQGYTRSYANEKLEGVTLHSILSKFRLYNATADDEKVLGATSGNNNGITTNTEFTNEMLLFIKSLVQEGRLTLYKDKAFATAHLLGENLDPTKQKYFYITALPINPEQQVIEKNPEINSVKFCLDPIGVSIKINELTPTMKDGDSNVNYPAEMYDVPLRIGLKQLKRTVISNLADNSTKEHQLWLPLRAITPVKEEGKDAGTTLKRYDKDDELYLVDTNDTKAMEEGSGAIIPETNIVDKVIIIGKLMDITAVKNGSNNVCKISFLKSFKFREGYWYTMKFHFSQQDASDQVCPGDLIFTIKVVPEYQMWTGAVSRNWNDDKNWRRVAKEDLLWSLNNTDVKSSDFLTANADYITDGGTNANEFSYAPADFTKVIIPTDVERVPFMYDMRSNTANQTITYAGAPKAGLQIVNGEPTDVATIGKPTETVIYDMASIDRSDNDVATRPWYDHTCDQIHFNAGAILMDQRYLYYNKAWCDIDVPVGTWQTVASPLMNIVAGDLYLPTATARQQTPLFEDITYQTTLNDRFKPAVFQRSWNKSMAKVYELNAGKTSVNERNVGVKLDWSHVYNDVNVRYGAGQGFSIKVDVSAMPTGDQPSIARFRFPKADKQYTYYNPSNTDGDKKTESVNSEDIIGGVRPGKLSDLSGTFQQMVGDTGNNQNPATPTNYFLVGNPLICWLDMQKFFEKNNQFESKYWIASADGQRTALFTGTEGWLSTLDGDAQFLAPGVSFFVELKQGQEDATGQPTSGATNVTTPQFTAEMMSYEQGEKSPTTNNDGSNTKSRAAEQSYIPQLRLTAEDGNGHKSVAMLTDGTVANHGMVETLFDSNLKDDIFLYTTKNGQAQSIANIMPGDTLPLVTAGLVDDVLLHIEGAEVFDCPLYIIDSEEGTIEPLTNDITLNCSTRGVRYYITSPKDKKEEMTISAPRVTAGNGRITIYAPANAIIEWAEIHSTNGTLVEKENGIDYSYSATLPSAIYLVRLSVEGHVYTYKLLLTDK